MRDIESKTNKGLIIKPHWGTYANQQKGSWLNGEIGTEQKHTCFLLDQSLLF